MDPSPPSSKREDLYGYHPWYLTRGKKDMSEYHHANKMDRSGCPKCGGDNASNNSFKFRCSECPFVFP